MGDPGVRPSSAEARFGGLAPARTEEERPAAPAPSAEPGPGRTNAEPPREEPIPTGASSCGRGPGSSSREARSREARCPGERSTGGRRLEAPAPAGRSRGAARRLRIPLHRPAARDRAFYHALCGRDVGPRPPGFARPSTRGLLAGDRSAIRGLLLAGDRSAIRRRGASAPFRAGPLDRTVRAIDLRSRFERARRGLTPPRVVRPVGRAAAGGRRCFRARGAIGAIGHTAALRCSIPASDRGSRDVSIHSAKAPGPAPPRLRRRSAPSSPKRRGRRAGRAAPRPSARAGPARWLPAAGARERGKEPAFPNPEGSMCAR